MPSHNAAIAQAVVDSLNAAVVAGDFAIPFVAARRYLPLREPDDLVDLAVTIVGGTDAQTRQSRGSNAHDIAVQIGIQRRLTADCDPTSEGAIEEIDNLIAAAEAIAGHFGPDRKWAGAHWFTTAHDPLVDPDHLHQQRIFTSLVTVTFKVL